MRERLTLLFFYYFFRSLLVVIAIGEWACLAWLLGALGATFPTWVHVAMPAVFYVANLLIVRLPARLPRPWNRVVEGYSAYAFTSVFGFAFLLLNTLAWSLIGLLTESVSWATTAQTANLATLPARAYDSSTTLGLATIGLLFAWGYTFGQKETIVTRHRVPFRRAGRELDRLTIAQISDIHIGRYMDEDLLNRFVDQVNELDADLVVVTGDLLDRTRDIPWGFPILARLRARLGVFVILGNHDVAAGADEVEAGLREHTPHTILRDQVATVRVGGDALHVVGLNDLGRDWARGVLTHPALDELLAGLPSGDPVLLLSHRPDLFRHAAECGVELTLSGHTHGGQISIPGRRRPLTLARFMTPYDRGLYREGDSTLYVNLGIGVTAQRIRLFAPREISLFEIDSRAS